jgi:hypothetical protein
MSDMSDCFLTTLLCKSESLCKCKKSCASPNHASLATVWRRRRAHGSGKRKAQHHPAAVLVAMLDEVWHNKYFHPPPPPNAALPYLLFGYIVTTCGDDMPNFATVRHQLHHSVLLGSTGFIIRLYTNINTSFTHTELPFVLEFAIDSLYWTIRCIL